MNHSTFIRVILTPLNALIRINEFLLCCNNFTSDKWNVIFFLPGFRLLKKNLPFIQDFFTSLFLEVLRKKIHFFRILEIKISYKFIKNLDPVLDKDMQTIPPPPLKRAVFIFCSK